ncbi:MAG: hypothetical protein J2P21_04330 [Chloracidobacterium sp.]|nr:hypothetical protein [Chloracidobacterium sp.]
MLGSSEAITNSSIVAGGAKQESDWPSYGRDPDGSRYSPLAQINRENVNSLKVAWTYRTGAVEVKALSEKTRRTRRRRSWWTACFT